jgi:AraC-like DNA-binding protein
MLDQQDSGDQPGVAMTRGHDCRGAVGYITPWLVAHGAVSAVRSALPGVVFIGDRGRFLEYVGRERPILALVPLVDAGGGSLAPIVSRVRHVSPTTRVVVVCSRTAHEGAVLLTTIRAGATAVHFVDDAGWELDLAEPRGVSNRHADADALVQRLVAETAPVSALLKICVERGTERLSVDALARAAGMSRRTLGRVCSRANGPAPHALLMWGRLLIGLTVLRADRAALGVAARAGGFASGRLFRRWLIRLTGHSPDILRAMPPDALYAELARRFGSLPARSGERSVVN